MSRTSDRKILKVHKKFVEKSQSRWSRGDTRKQRQENDIPFLSVTMPYQFLRKLPAFFFPSIFITSVKKRKLKTQILNLKFKKKLKTAILPLPMQNYYRNLIIFVISHPISWVP